MIGLVRLRRRRDKPSKRVPWGIMTLSIGARNRSGIHSRHSEKNTKSNPKFHLREKV
jgi:hypothetical protein